MQLTKRVLKHKTKEVEFKYPVQNKQLEDELLKTMHREGGVGLAANQVGIKKSLFVMAVDGIEWAFFNPSIVNFDTDTEVFSEGCLSFPGEYVEIVRPIKLTLHWQDYVGNHFEQSFTGMAARIIQHEFDHLHGLTMYDRINSNQPQKEVV